MFYYDGISFYGYNFSNKDITELNTNTNKIPSQIFILNEEICGLITATRQIPTKKDPTKFIKTGVIEDLTGKKHELNDCLGCEIIRGNLTPFGGVLYKDKDNKEAFKHNVLKSGFLFISTTALSIELYLEIFPSKVFCQTILLPLVTVHLKIVHHLQV